MEPLEEPEYSYLTDWLVSAYVQIRRARRYEQGHPLPLALADIAAFADCYPLPCSRDLLNRAVFALDDEELSSV
ncbi:hypothetical protein EGK75_09105 [Neisseria weixii]|uniref:Uncharacterized protein n=1 Tax=Neisseria weixii TaxID=1853276 RepID=A0A3N4N045_9NEIS|nr:hypothetical protein [Neisseria weixii]RPD86269.1 hypothetical protein EGK75_09105 [Neisseria weixii]RPD89411.1 hypothetical protein EGK74_04110 [Neisseria weixii]